MEDLVLAIKYVLLVVLGLLPIMNPLGTVPLFLALTAPMPEAQRRQQAQRTCLYAFAILSTFLFLGNGIIALFGISLAGIRVAGGMIVIVLAFRMLFSGVDQASEVDATPSEIKRAEVDFSFSPLAMPSLSGPGSIAVVMGYGSEIPGNSVILGHLVVVLGIALSTAVAYAALTFSSWISRFLGPHGLQAITKIMGFLLACIAVQFIASGIRDFVHSLA